MSPDKNMECLISRHNASKTTIIGIFISYAVAIVFQSIFAPDTVWITVISMIAVVPLLVYVFSIAFNCGEDVEM